MHKKQTRRVFFCSSNGMGNNKHAKRMCKHGPLTIHIHLSNLRGILAKSIQDRIT